MREREMDEVMSRGMERELEAGRWGGRVQGFI